MGEEPSRLGDSRANPQGGSGPGEEPSRLGGQQGKIHEVGVGLEKSLPGWGNSKGKSTRWEWAWYVGRKREREGKWEEMRSERQ